MTYDQPARCFWRYHPEDEHRLSFIASRQNEGDKVLMTFRLYEPEKLMSVAVWLGERQRLWEEWQQIAEGADGWTLDRHLSSMLPDCFASVEEVIISEGSQGSQEVTLTIHLLPERQVELFRHVFQSEEAQKAFLGWAGQAKLGQRFGLSLIGLLEGEKSLSSKMEEIASSRLDFGHKVMNAMLKALRDGSDEAFIPAEEDHS